MRAKELLRLTGVPIFIASLCCLAPIVVVLSGLGSVALAASLTNLLDGQYRWAFSLAGVAILSISFIFHFRSKGICTVAQAKKRKNEVVNTILIVSFTAIIGYIIFFYGILTITGQIIGIWK